jgi:hypothetical protein
MDSLMIIESVHGAFNARFGLCMCQALNSIDVGLLLWC